ncbi:MAG: hypothetical protein ACREDR_30700 [Blastocatellia bacterium]
MFNLEPISMALFRRDDIEPVCDSEAFSGVTTTGTHDANGKADTLTQ